jgi:hypothetical protein
MLWNWLTEWLGTGKLFHMNIEPTNTFTVICRTCRAENRIPVGTLPSGYHCGNCHNMTLEYKAPIQNPATGTIITSAAVGTGFGAIVGGPVGAVLGGIAGWAIGIGATGTSGDFRKKKPDGK